MRKIDGGAAKITSLRELRRVRCYNEREKVAACERVKDGVSSTFSLSNLLLEFIRSCAPEKMRRYSDLLFSLLKE